MPKKIPLNSEEANRLKLPVRYDEKSPITGNFSVLVERVEMGTEEAPLNDLYKICMDTGYQTYWDSWKSENREILDAVEAQMPKHVIDHKHVDSLGHVWYPMMAISYTLAFYPQVNDNNQLIWALSQVSPVQSEAEMDGSYQLLQLPIQTEEGPKLSVFKIHQPDQIWELTEFENAFDQYQLAITQTINNHKNDEQVSAD